MELTKKTATECIESITAVLKPVVGLDDWDFNWIFEQMDANDNGTVPLGHAKVDYSHSRVVIFLDIGRHDENLEDLVDTIRHEVLHATHFMWNRAITLASRMLPEGSGEVMEAVWNDAVEEHVTYMSHFLDRIGFSVPELMKHFENHKNGGVENGGESPDNGDGPSRA